MITKTVNDAHLSHLKAQAFAVVHNLSVLDLKKVNGAVSLILATISSYKEDSMIQFDTCQALLQFCCRFPNAAKKLQSEDASQILALSKF